MNSEYLSLKLVERNNKLDGIVINEVYDVKI